MTCPFCGEKANDGGQTRNGTQYECGTFVWDDEIDRSNQSPKCIDAEVGALKARIARLEDSLTSIREYWNRDNNDRAMQDACWHAINTASEALDTKETKP